MQEIKHSLNITIRSTLRLSEVERLIKKHRIIVPAPSRKGLRAMCEQGAFQTVSDQPSRLGWLVYEDSFWEWVKEMNEGRWPPRAFPRRLMHAGWKSCMRRPRAQQSESFFVSSRSQLTLKRARL